MFRKDTKKSVLPVTPQRRFGEISQAMQMRWRTTFGLVIISMRWAILATLDLLRNNLSMEWID